MKKHLKRLAVTVTVLFALLGATGTVAFASGYITWGGSQDYQQTLINLNLISKRGGELKSERDELGNSNEQLQNVIKDKDNKIKDKDNKITALEQDIKALEKRVEDGNKTTQDQLGQAEKDMKHVNQRSQEVLNEFNQGD